MGNNEDIIAMAECLNEDSPYEALLSVSALSESIAMSAAKTLSTSMITKSDKKQGVGSNIHGKMRHSRFLQNQNEKNNARKNKNEQASQEEKAEEQERYPICLPSSLQFIPSSKLRHQLNSNAENNNQNMDDSTVNDFRGEAVNISPYLNSTNSSIDTSVVCSESILSSLSKIAQGGSKASTEMRQLEDQRYVYETEATDVSNALKLREYSNLASSALSAQRYKEAALNVQSFRNILSSNRAKEWAGKSTLRQFARTEDVLQRVIMEKYEQAVGRGDLNGLSELTPLLGTLHLASDGVALYLKYSRDALFQAMEVQPVKSVENNSDLATEGQGKRLTRRQQQELQQQQQQQMALAEENKICSRLARIFNAGVTHLRHHLPMVASSLGDADGDAALVQLVYLEVEKRANQYWKEFANDKKLSSLESKASRVTTRIEEKYVNGLGMNMDEEEENDDVLEGEGMLGNSNSHNSSSGNLSSGLTLSYYDDEENDCGFNAALGSLADLDQVMDETALALQHTESYERFIRHAVDQVIKARELRMIKKRNEQKWKQEQLLDKDRDDNKNNDENPVEEVEEKMDYEEAAIKILPTHTELNETVAEIGGYYSGLERSLLLASMQRAFLSAETSADSDPGKYSPMGIMVESVPGDNRNGISSSQSLARNPLQTSVVEECLYAAQRSTMRAFATGHSGTACAAANFCSDSLGRVLLEVLIRRAEDSTASLKPGEGLLEGNGGLGQAALSVINSGQKRLKMAGKKTEEKNTDLDSVEMKRKIYVGIAHACAHYNDMEVAAAYTQRLENQFLEEIDSTFPPGNMTEQLRMCVKSLTPVHESFQNASKRCIEQLVIQILPRVRSITNDAVGQEGTATTSFMKTSVIGRDAGNASTVKMNYDLDDEAYELSQISEGYMNKM